MNYLPKLASSFDPPDCCLLSIRVTGVSHRHLATKCHIKRHGEGRERKFIPQLRTCCGKRQSEHSAHVQPSLGYRHELQV
jgi:hypothetical protein